MDLWTRSVGQQLGAAIDMLGNAVRACPAHVWEEPGKPVEKQFWYVAFHVAFFLDLYLTGSLEGFAPPPPFDLSEADPRGVFPERTYTPAEIGAYVAHGRAKCRTVLAGLTAERALEACPFPWGTLPFAELLLYNLRHVQHHTAQLNLRLRQGADLGSRWVVKGTV
jgi:hypothetical protein